MTTEPTVYIVEHDASTRETLESLAESVGLAVESYSSCEEFMSANTNGTPGCLVLDVKMPGMGGFELLDRLAERGSSLPVIMISEFGDASMAVRALENGAIDFITKPINNQLLLDRIRQALNQHVLIRKNRSDTVMIRERFGTLTPREQEVMTLVIAGKANKMIAADLGVSTKTVEGHRARVMEKMQAESLATLVRMGVVLETAGNKHGRYGGGVLCIALAPQPIS